MSGLFWACIGTDEQLLERCSSVERDRLAFWGGYLLLLIVTLSMATMRLSLAILDGQLQFQFNWKHWLIALLVAAFVGLYALGLFRLVFFANRSLRIRLSRPVQAWQLTFWLKLLLLMPMAVICSMAAQLSLLGSETLHTPGAHANERVTVSSNISDVRQSAALDELYLRLSKAVAGGAGSTETAQALRQEISAMREFRSVRVAEASVAPRAALGVVQGIYLLWGQRLGWTAAVTFIFIFFFSAPLIIKEIAEQGTYEYVDEYQGIVSLAVKRIIPNAGLMWLGETRHFIDRYLAAEEVAQTKAGNHRALRVRVKRGLGHALATRRQQFSAASQSGS